MNSGNTRKRFQWKYSLEGYEATLLILFVVLFLPSSASFQGGEVSIASDISSLMWRLIFYRNGAVGYELNLYAIAYFHYVFFKYLLVFQVSRYYRLRTTRKGVLIVAVLSELQWFVMFDVPKIIRFFLEGANWTTALWILPIPIALVVCILLLFLVPRSGAEPTWIEEEEDISWVKKME